MMLAPNVIFFKTGLSLKAVNDSSKNRKPIGNKANSFCFLLVIVFLIMQFMPLLSFKLPAFPLVTSKKGVNHYRCTEERINDAA